MKSYEFHHFMRSPFFKWCKFHSIRDQMLEKKCKGTWIVCIH